jgi:porin
MRLASASHPVSSATTCDGPQQKGLLPGPPGGQDYETVIELTYRFDLRNGALFIQPDLQYIIQPGGTSHIENALVLGTQIGINF